MHDTVYTASISDSSKEDVLSLKSFPLFTAVAKYLKVQLFCLILQTDVWPVLGFNAFYDAWKTVPIFKALSVPVSWTNR